MSRGRAQARSVGALAASLLVVGAMLLLAPVRVSQADPSGSCSTTTSIGEACRPDPILTTSSTGASGVTSTSARVTTSTVRSTSTTVVRAASTTSIAKADDAKTTTSATTEDRARLLVPGDGTEGAELTTTTEADATSIGGGGPSDGTLIALVVVGLVLVAGLVGVLTWRYWIATRPPIVHRDHRPRAAG